MQIHPNAIPTRKEVVLLTLSIIAHGLLLSLSRASRNGISEGSSQQKPRLVCYELTYSATISHMTALGVTEL